MDSENNSKSVLSYISLPSISLKKILFYLITIAVLAAIYFKFPELQLIGRLFRGENWYWLAALVVAQIIIYYSQALNYKYVLEIKGLKIGVNELFPMSVVVQFINNALPSLGLAGQAFFVQYLRKYKVSIADGIGRAFIEVMTLYMTVGFFFIISSVLLFKTNAIENIPQIRFLIYFFVFIALITLGVFFMINRKKRSKFTKWLINKLHLYFEKKKSNKESGANHTSHVEEIFNQFNDLTVRSLENHIKPFWAAFFWHNMVFLGHVLTLYLASFIVGHPIDFQLAFIVFSLVKFLTMISFVPGSLGVFEGGMTLILISFGVPAGPAFSMTLILRAFTFWLPMPMGWILYRFYFRSLEDKEVIA